MKKCPDCHISVLCGMRFATCENCGKVYDLTYKHSRYRIAWHPFWGVAMLTIVLLLICIVLVR